MRIPIFGNPPPHNKLLSTPLTLVPRLRRSRLPTASSQTVSNPVNVLLLAGGSGRRAPAPTNTRTRDAHIVTAAHIAQVLSNKHVFGSSYSLPVSRHVRLVVSV